MVLSDRTIARLLDEGRIEIDPYDPALLQPSSVDVRVDRFFRVFHNARYAFIDVKEQQEDLTELVEIDNERPFILHPGEFVLGSTLERPPQARLIRHVSFGQLAALRRERPGLAPVADETPDGSSRLTQCVHDVAADEACPARD